MDTVSMLNKMSFYCQPILPLVYDESMSYYETLCKVVGQLNTTGETVNKLNAGLTEEATERENADAALGARLAELEKTFANVHLIAFESPGRIIGTTPTREQLYKWVTSGDVICTLLRTSEPGRENIFAVTCNYDAGSYLSPLSNDFEIVVPIKTSYNENNDTAVSQKLVKLTIPDGELSEPWGYQEFEIKTPATSADGIVNVNARHYNTGTIDVNITPGEFLGMFYTHKAGAQIAVGVNARLTYDGRDYASGSAVVSVGDGTNGKVIIEFNNYYNGVFTENNVDQLKTQHIFLVGAQATNTWAIETIDSHTYDLERDKAFEFTHNVDGTVTTGEDSTPSEVAFYYERNDKLYQNIPVRLIDTKDNAEYWNGVFDRKSDGRISYTFTTSYYRASKMLVRIIELSATPKSGSTFAGDEKWVYAAKEFELPLDNATQSAAGLMSAADKAKLDGVEDGATKTIVDDAMSDTSTNPVQNKVVMKYIDSRGSLPPVSVKNDTMLIQVVDGAYALRTKESIFPVDDALDTESKNAVENGIIARRFEQLSGVTLPATSKRDGLMTAANYSKLSGIEAGATKTIVDATLDETSTNPVQNKTVKTALDGKASTAEATTGAAGLMSAADKAKLDGVEDGATKTIVDDAMSDTSTNPVQNKAVKAALDSKLSTQGGEISGHLSVGLTVSAEGSVSTGRTSTDTGIHFEKAGSDVGRISHGSDPMTGVSPIARLKVASPTEDDDAATKAYVDGRAVRYDAAQTLTDAQKAQARENVDAASAFTPILTSPVMIRKERATDSAGVYLSTIDIGEKHAEIRLEDVNENAPVAIANLRTPTGTGTDNYAATKGYVDSKVASGGGGVTVDDAMSDTSTNPVQNKTIKQYVDNHLSGAPITIKLGTGHAATSTATFAEIKAALEAGKAPILDSASGTNHWFALNWMLYGSDSLIIQYGTFNVEGGGLANFTIYDVSVSSTGITYASRRYTTE